MEGVSQKIRRQIEELERISGVESNALTVDGVPVDSYLTRYICHFQGVNCNFDGDRVCQRTKLLLIGLKVCVG